MRAMGLALTASLLFAFAGCSDDSASADAHPLDAAVTVDAPVTAVDASPTVDAPATSCSIAASVTVPSPDTLSGTITCLSSGAVVACAAVDPSGADVYDDNINAPLNSDTKPDLLMIQLYPGTGEYATAVGPGTYSLTSSGNSNYSTCASCIIAWGNVDMSASPLVAEQKFFQTGGTLTITAVTPGAAGNPHATITGSVSGLTLTHVTINSSWVSTPVGDGCDISIPDFTFSASLVDASTAG